MKDLSIIIPVYNTEQYLEKCLNSVFKNLPNNSEVIIVNDGSPDNSEEIIQKFIQKYSDIILYFKKENGGLSSVKNFGLTKATGKYITFIDSDDYIDENMHKTMLNKAISEDADIIYCDVEEVFEDGSTLPVSCTNPNRDTDFFKAIDTPLMAASWNKLAKRELYVNLTYPEGLNNEDVTVTPILFARAKKIIAIDKPFYKYLQRTGSIQNSKFTSKRFVIMETSKRCFENAKEFDIEIQEQIKGSILTHQIIALLIYPISELKKNERNKLIYEFVDKINEFGDDLYNNKYVIEYFNLLHRTPIFKAIKQKKYKKLTFLISYYNLKKKLSKFKRILKIN